MDFKAPQELWNPLSKAVLGKLHGSGGHSKCNFSQDQANFYSSWAWQIALVLTLLDVCVSFCKVLLPVFSNLKFPSRSFVLVYIYIYIYTYALLYEFCFLWFTNCVLLPYGNSLIPGCLWLMAFVLNNTLIIGMWCSTIPQLPGCFSPWTFFQNMGFNMVPALWPLYVTSSYWTWIFCRGVSGFATDCPCDVWCRGLTTCLLHVSPPFGNRCRFDILDSISSFFVFWHMQLYVSWYIISFFGFIFTS